MISSINTLGPGEELFAAASNVAVASGQLLFIREGTLMARPFDPETATFQGDGVPVAEVCRKLGSSEQTFYSLEDMPPSAFAARIQRLQPDPCSQA